MVVLLILRLTRGWRRHLMLGGTSSPPQPSASAGGDANRRSGWRDSEDPDWIRFGGRGNEGGRSNRCLATTPRRRVVSEDRTAFLFSVSSDCQPGGITRLRLLEVPGGGLPSPPRAAALQAIADRCTFVWHGHAPSVVRARADQRQTAVLERSPKRRTDADGGGYLAQSPPARAPTRSLPGWDDAKRYAQ